MCEDQSSESSQEDLEEETEISDHQPFEYGDYKQDEDQLIIRETPYLNFITDELKVNLNKLLPQTILSNLYDY